MSVLKTMLLTTLLLSITLSSAIANDQAKLNDMNQKMSYMLGRQIGVQLKGTEIDIDLDAFTDGVSESLAGSDLRLSDDEIRKVSAAIQTQIANVQKKAQERQARLVTENLKKGEAFLAANAGKKGVTVLPSGLQYKVITPGTGKSPDSRGSVTVHYTGTLIDGTVFDSSVERGQPITFPVNGVIKGWTEALQLMKEGAKWQLFIPADLAYGPRGSGANIGPNETLLFDVELIKVN